LELNRIIEERIGSLREEVEIATNVKLNPLYIIDRKDEIESLWWTTRITMGFRSGYQRMAAAAWSKQYTRGVGSWKTLRNLKICYMKKFKS
jgi:hypothetical protein